MLTLNCEISSKPISYEVVIRNGCCLKGELLPQIEMKRLAIISDTNVSALYGREMQKNFAAKGFNVSLFTFAGGEKAKSRQIKEELENALLDRGFGKESCIVALGGGVVCDLSGYLAATFCRGVPLILMPTSLLAMADACIGGKTGVNVPQGKNLVGAFYQPKKIFIDPQFLHSLPHKEMSHGIVEMIKHGLIADESYFEFVEANAESILQLKGLEKAIFESCRIKKEIVEKDEKESGLRQLLNLGHTIGHALEQASNYELPHGEAVAIGLLVEGYLSSISDRELQRVYQLLKRCALPLRLPAGIDKARLMNAMQYDKKTQTQIPRFVFLQKIGLPFVNQCSFSHSVSEERLYYALEWMFTTLHRD